MVCPTCLIGLAGFGEDGPSPVQLPTQVAQNLGAGAIALVATPALAAVVAGIIGALAWRRHRVVGGVSGALLGGAVGGIIGAKIAAAKAASALPALQQAVQDAGQAASPIAAPPGGFSIGPASVTGWNLARPLLPALAKLGTASKPGATATTATTGPTQIPSEGARVVAAGTTLNQLLKLAPVTGSGSLPAASVMGAQTPSPCTKELRVCPDGTRVGRRWPSCAFDPCPTPPRVAVPGMASAATPSAATMVAPAPSGSGSAQTPPPCTKELRVCPDGTRVGRRWPSCAFDPCPMPPRQPITSAIAKVPLLATLFGLGPVSQPAPQPVSTTMPAAMTGR